LRLDTEADARAVEATLKAELAEFRAEAPVWVPPEAGGHTEWFAAVHFGRAEDRLRSFVTGSAAVSDAAAYFRCELERRSRSAMPRRLLTHCDPHSGSPRLCATGSMRIASSTCRCSRTIRKRAAS